MKPTVIGLVKAISIAALIFPADILARVNPKEINDFNRERQQVGPHREALTSKVESAATPEEIAQRLEALNLVIANDPNNPKPYLSRAQVWMSAGNYNSAISDLPRTIAIDPKNIEPYVFLGQIQMNQTDGRKQSSLIPITHREPMLYEEMPSSPKATWPGPKQTWLNQNASRHISPLPGWSGSRSSSQRKHRSCAIEQTRPEVELSLGTRGAGYGKRLESA